MFLLIGTPKRLSDLGITRPEVKELKNKIEIAIVDDEPFLWINPLRAHGFRVTEIGGDIRSVDQVSAYPIVICDIRGVGKAFASRHEGAHVVAEIRKTYPDKYLIAYTGATYDPSYNQKLAASDTVLAKDAPIDAWIQVLENGLAEVADPKARWIRFRSKLLDRGIELYELLKLEQAFINSIDARNSAIFTREVQHSHFPEDIKDLIIKFSAGALVELIAHLIV